MKIESINRERSKIEMSDWLNRNQEIKTLSSDYTILRKDLCDLYHKAERACNDTDVKKDYLLDINYGVLIYDYFNTKDWFNLRIASDDGFWRYLSVVTIPDIVAKRWGDNNETHFWKQSNRIWLKTIWWYIYLTWNHSSKETISMLSGFGFNTDIIQGLVERSGHKGVYVNVYRTIVLCYSKIDSNTIIRFKKKQASKSDNLFRAIMRLNTARTLVVDPCLCKGGEEGYAVSLFKAFNIDIQL